MNACIRLARLCLLCVVAVATMYGSAHAQTSGMTIDEADKIFLENNLYLLAGSLNVSAQRAAEIQAKTYPNPEFSAVLNLRDPENDKWFHNGTTGQKEFGIEQTILLGGKRKNEIALARQNTRQAELMLEDLLRNLQWKLHTSMYSIHFDDRTLRKYTSQLQLLDTIIDSYEIQAAKGNVSLKEVMRLKSVYLQLNNAKTEVMQRIQEEQKDLQVLLQTKAFIMPDISEERWGRYDYLPNIDSLVLLAEQNRADWKMADLGKGIANMNLKLQRSNAMPDLNLGAAYDQRGGAFGNQVSLTLGMPVPLWNRNRGNIRIAKMQQQMADVQYQTAEQEITAEVTEAWYNMQRSIQESKKLRQLYTEEFNTVFMGINNNFVKRNISFLEFIDFFEAYNVSMAEISQIRKQLALSAEQINYTTGYRVYQ